MSETHTITHVGGGDLPPWWFRLGARIRGAASLLGFIGIAAGLIAIAVVPDLSPALILLLCVGGFGLLVVGLGLTFVPRRAEHRRPHRSRRPSAGAGS